MHWRGEGSLAARSRWAASSITGTVIGRLAADVTETSARRSCLVLSPHPDDETLACGATMARKLDAGTEVHVLVLSDGATWPPDRTASENVAGRHAELLRASAEIGLPPAAVTQLDFPETGLSAVVDALVDAVADAVRRVRPDEVLSTSVADPHADHAAVGRAAAQAIQGSARRWLTYPVWQWRHPRAWTRTQAGASRPEAVSTSGYLWRKRRALAEYRSQISLTEDEARAYTIGPLLLRHFLSGREVFFPVRLR